VASRTLTESLEARNRRLARGRAYYQRNKESLLARNRAYFLADRPARLEKQRKYNRDKSLEINAKLSAKRIANPEMYRERDRIRNEKRREKRRLYRQARKSIIAAQKRLRERTDPQFRLQCRLRNRLWDVMRGRQKAGSAVQNLGCSIAEFRCYLMALWKPGMSWENWGQYGWHLDHIRPLASFDLTDPQQFALAAHFSNYQPLWWRDNIRKGAKVI